MNKFIALLFVVSSLFNYKILLAGTSMLKKVETSKVCMITNRVFDAEQIPITFEGKTYYGCCQMCKQTLKNDITTRYAKDPVSEERVDKSSAVIAAMPDGSVLYFEDEDTLKRYELGQ